ncbi:MAG: outer membrane protein assembly factor BamE [Spirochaetes bacterium]|nr:outer membrane protein assembly factor BamE [Spirochaetota bacterium]
MKRALGIVAVVAVALLFIAADKTPSADELIDQLGARHSKVFCKYGVPIKMHIDRGPTKEEDYIIFDYLQFGFVFHREMIRQVLFYPEWKGGKIRNISMGMTKEQVIKIMGTPEEEVALNDGRTRITYLEPDKYFDIILSTNNIVTMVRFEVK